MLFTNIDYLDSNFEIKQGFVGTAKGRIVYIGETDPTYAASISEASVYDFGERYDGSGKLLIPGLYNTHTHAPMTLLRGYAENLALQEWLHTKIFPFEAKITDEIAYPATMLAIAEMLRFGTVSFSDMYFFTDARIKAVLDSGIKANLCHGLLVFDEETTYEQLSGRELNDRYVKEYHNTADGRLKIDLNIHSEYLSNPKVVAAVAEHAQELGVNTHAHLSETRLEHEECKQRRGGLTPTQYFESLGLFNTPCTAAHCVYTEPQDWEIFVKHGVTASANPVSNMKLASGFAPFPQMLDAGVNVGIGTDGMASNNNHNLFKDIYLFALLYKGAAGDPTLITPAQALAAATSAGARAQRREDCGCIEVGKRADLAVLDVTHPWMQPVNDQVNNLIFSAQGTDVVLTMVDDVVLYRDGVWPTIDIERVIAQTQKASDLIKSQL